MNNNNTCGLLSRFVLLLFFSWTINLAKNHIDLHCNIIITTCNITLNTIETRGELYIMQPPRAS